MDFKKGGGSMFVCLLSRVFSTVNMINAIFAIKIVNWFQKAWLILKLSSTYYDDEKIIIKVTWMSETAPLTLGSYVLQKG